MNVIYHPNNEIMEKLGGIQILIPSKKYRLNKYVIKETYNDRIILYNGFNGALMDVNEDEYNNCINIVRDVDYVDFFFRNYFVVPEEYDETSVLKKIKTDKFNGIYEDYLKKTNFYTILPTTGCNARCFYCYEHGTKVKSMSIETAEKIASLIIRRYKSNNGDVSLHWFGGEPTLNTAVIDRICNMLKDNGVPFKGDIVSNGYLFNEELSKKAKELWNITNAQITIDGTEEVYNKTKAYVYKNDPNPFRTVINNIRNLISNGIRVNIRLNVDLYNSEDVKNVIKQIHDEFGPENLLSVYAHPIFEGYGVNRTEEHLKKTVDKLDEIEDVLDEYGYIGPLPHSNNLNTHHCMADGGDSLLFAPDGSMGLCEHYVDNNFIGHIDNPDEIDFDIVKKFNEKEDDLDICGDCSNYINCIRLSMCEDLRDCNEEYKRWRVNQIRKKIRVTMREYYKKLNECSCNSNLNLNDIMRSLENLHNKVDTIYNLLINR